IYATAGTHRFFKRNGVTSIKLHKIHENKAPSVETAVTNKQADLIICIPDNAEDDQDARKIRRLAIDNHTPLMTNAETGRLLLKCLTDEQLGQLEPRHWQEYFLL
ncbi:MAG: hypothetical protein ACREHG_10365, partial [Candidatus Saccharimonadales bacterium]